MITRRNQDFINYYLLCKNGAEACRKAYPKIKASDRYAHILLSKIEVKEAIEAKLALLDISKEDIKRSLTEIAKTGKIEANRIRCYEILAKIEGLLKDVTTQTTVNVVDTINAIKQEPAQNTIDV